MSTNSLHFKAVLIGTKTPAEHISQLAANPVFRIQSTEEGLSLRIKVAGPLKDTGTTSFENILSQCRTRATKLGLASTGLAESTATQIEYANIAESHILASPLSIHLVQQATGSLGELILEVAEEGPRGARDCFQDYAHWRILCVVHAMGMQIEGNQSRN